MAEINKIVRDLWHAEHKNYGVSIIKVFNKKHAKEFVGIKNIPIEDIQVDKKFQKNSPKEDKIQELMDYYALHGTLDKPIVVEYKNGKYILKDKYLRYIVAQKVGMKEIPAQVSTAKDMKDMKQLRKKGTRVWHKKYKKGTVIDSDFQTVQIRFDSGQEAKFEMNTCLQTGILKIL